MALSRFVLPFSDVGSGIKPSDGALLYFFETGTSTPADTFSVSTGGAGNENTNPVVADSTGVFPDIFLEGTFKVRLENKNFIQIWEADPVESDAQDLNAIARSLNVPNSAVIRSTDTDTVLDNVLYIYDSTAEIIYGKPAGVVAAGEKITSTSGNLLNTDLPAAYTMPIVSHSYTEHVSVVAYGEPDGVNPDTPKFAAALSVSNSVYVPYRVIPYKVSGLNLEFDQVIYGEGLIETTNGTIINLAKVNLEVSDAPMKVMFTNGIHSWEEMLAIKSLGMNTMICITSYDTTAVAIRNLEAVGLRCLVFGEIYGINLPWTVKDEFKDRESVIGFYPFDEPVTKGMSLVEQNQVIDAYRAVSDKPIFTSENAVVLTDGVSVISQQLDYIFTDQYYFDGYAALPTGINTAVINTMRNMQELAVENRKCGFIPMLGLFNEAPLFNQSVPDSIKLAKHLSRFSTNGAFGCFVWDVAPTLADVSFVGCRNNTDYQNALKDIVAVATVQKPWLVEYIPLGKSNGGNSKLINTMQYVADGINPGEKAVANVFPWDVVNAGSAIDDRRQNFELSGIALMSNGGRAVFNGMPSGVAALYMDFTNEFDASTATASIGASDTGGYNYHQAALNLNITGAGQGVYGGELSIHSYNSPVIDFSVSGVIGKPFTAVSGYLVFSDATLIL